MFVKDMDNSALSPSLSGDLDSTSSGGTVSDSANQSVMSPESYCSQILFNPNGRWFFTICIKLRRRNEWLCQRSDLDLQRFGVGFQCFLISLLVLWSLFLTVGKWNLLRSQSIYYFRDFLRVLLNIINNLEALSKHLSVNFSRIVKCKRVVNIIFTEFAVNVFYLVNRRRQYFEYLYTMLPWAKIKKLELLRLFHFVI